MTVERVYVYWDRAGRAPAPGKTVTLDDGSLAVVETAHASSGQAWKRKLVVKVTRDGEPVRRVTVDGLADLQATVGGEIEAVDTAVLGDQLTSYINAEGKLNGCQ